MYLKTKFDHQKKKMYIKTKIVFEIKLCAAKEHWCRRSAAVDGAAVCRRVKILEEWELDNPLKKDNQVMTRGASASSDYK